MFLGSIRRLLPVASRAAVGAAIVMASVGVLGLSSCTGMASAKGTPVLNAEDWRSYDGKVMPWRPSEVPEGQPIKAVVVTIHGLSGAALDFWPIGDALPPKGIAVYGIELRGQGNDPDVKRRGDIRSAKVWQKDLSTFNELVRRKHPGLPVIWYAESLGTLIAINTLVDLPPQDRPVGIVCSSPAAGLRLQPKASQYWLLRIATTVLPGKKVNLEKLAGVDDRDIRVTHDTTHEAQMARTPHYVPEFSLRLLGQIDRMMRDLPEAARRTTLPVLVMASPNDVIASPEQIQSFYDELSSKDKKLNWYRRSYHLLLHDTERQQVLADGTHWIESHLK